MITLFKLILHALTMVMIGLVIALIAVFSPKYAALFIMDVAEKTKAKLNDTSK